MSIQAMPEEGLITRTTSRAPQSAPAIITRGFRLILLLTTSIMGVNVAKRCVVYCSLLLLAGHYAKTTDV